jgi:hypothetical protein
VRSGPSRPCGGVTSRRAPAKGRPWRSGCDPLIPRLSHRGFVAFGYRRCCSWLKRRRQTRRRPGAEAEAARVAVPAHPAGRGTGREGAAPRDPRCSPRRLGSARLLGRPGGTATHHGLGPSDNPCTRPTLGSGGSPPRHRARARIPRRHTRARHAPADTARRVRDSSTVADGDEPMVEVEFVVRLARRIARGELTREAAAIAVDLAAGREVGL